jgi:GntR family transcriptional repressor for pyruvate dehydrogenase complex
MHQIKQQILAGGYAPAAKLPTVVELAASFEVGRSTIRDALSALKAMGWVDIRHGGGTFVSKILPNEIGKAHGGLFYKTESFQEVLEVRKFIEVGCATLEMIWQETWNWLSGRICSTADSIPADPETIDRG